MLFVFVLPALILLALLAYAKPQTATVLLVALTPVYLIKFSILGIPTNLFEISVLIVFSGSFVQKSIRQWWRKVIKQMPRWAMFFVMLFVLTAIASTVVSPHLKTSLGIFKGWIFIPLLVGWLVYAFGKSSKSNNFYEQILRALVVSGLFVSVVGLSQIGQLNRIRSIYDVSNSLALFIVPLLVVAFYLTINGYRTVNLLAMIIMASALVATQSVAGMVAATIAMMVGVVIKWQPDKNKGVVLVGIVFIIFFVAAFFLVINTTGRLNYLASPWSSQGGHNSISVRWQLWDISYDLLRQHPFLGIGLGTFEPAYQRELHARFSQYNNCKLADENCMEPLAEFVYRDPHNWLLSFWLNMGLVGLFSFVAINVVVIGKAVVRIRSMSHSANHVLVIATILALVSVLLFGLTDTIYWKNDLSALHWILIALLIIGL